MSELNNFKSKFPIGWNTDFFEQVVFFQEGPGLRTWQFTSKGMRVLTVTNIISDGSIDMNANERFISIEEFSLKYKHFSIEEGDIVLASSGNTIGKTGKIKKEHLPAIVNTSTIRFNNSKSINKISMNYLYAYLRSSFFKDQLFSYSTGSAQPNVGPTHIKRMLIAYPDIVLQERIGEILTSLDDKIELNNKINHELESLAQLLFKRWFVDFEFPNENGEPYKLNGGEMIDSELGEIPKGWKTGTLNEILVLQGGTTPSTKEPKFWNGNIHWTSPRDLSSLKFPLLTRTEKTITKLGLSKISSGLLPIGTLLLSSRAPIGYLAITDIKTAINQGYIAINGKEGFSNLYILYWLKSNMDLVIERANGSTFLEISKSNFKEIKTIIPDQGVLKNYVHQVEVLFGQLKNNIIETQELINLRDTLLPKLISGELELNKN